LVQLISRGSFFAEQPVATRASHVDLFARTNVVSSAELGSCDSE